MSDEIRRLQYLEVLTARLEAQMSTLERDLARVQRGFDECQRERDEQACRIAALEDQLKTLGAELPDGEVQVH